ncbi:hypothetical protein CWN04_14355 [Klebsiella michiganensis]|nr:hypothetical protein CWN04_14355 [Klebsiella michiganensis]
MNKSTITRERLEEIRDCCWMDDLGLSMYELSELARISLDAMDSEPVAWKVRFKIEGQPGSNFNKFFENRKAMNDVVSLHELGGFNIDVTPLYRHAQQPVVPEEMTKSLASIAKEYQTTPQNALFIVVGWNACRAAMLNGGK